MAFLLRAEAREAEENTLSSSFMYTPDDLAGYYV